MDMFRMSIAFNKKGLLFAIAHALIEAI